jgi:hypothetical protein
MYNNGFGLVKMAIRENHFSAGMLISVFKIGCEMI